MISMINDNAGHKVPIIAWDFDGTLCKHAKFPSIGEIRPFAMEVVNFLYDIGVHTTIWTCRSISDDGYTQNDLTMAVKWLNDNGFKYHDINKCIVPAGFNYESRKIFAHRYVDDRAFGWVECRTILVQAMYEFITNVIGMDIEFAGDVANEIIVHGREIDSDTIAKARGYVDKWSS